MGFFFLVIWFAGVIVPLYPFIMGFDGFSQFWKFDFADKNGSIDAALLLYTAALLFVLVGCYLGRKTQFAAPAKVRYIASARILSQRSFVLTVIALLAFTMILVVLGGVSGLLQGASDRIRAFAGLNGLFLLQNLFLSVSLAWFIRLTRGKKGSFLNDSAFGCIFLRGYLFAHCKGRNRPFLLLCCR